MSEKNLNDDKEYWEFVKRTAREVRETPKWVGGDKSDDELAIPQHCTRYSKGRTRAQRAR
jgi:hypothetical protein